MTMTVFTCLFDYLRSPLLLSWTENNAFSLVLIKLLLLTNHPFVSVVFMPIKNTASKRSMN